MTRPVSSAQPSSVSAPRPDWGFLLDDLTDRVPGIAHAVAVTADGLLLAKSTNFGKDQADHLAAYTAGMESLTRGGATLMNGGPVEQVVVDMAAGRIVVMAIGDGSALTVLATKNCDMGQISYEMAMLINRVGAALTPAARAPHSE